MASRCGEPFVYFRHFEKRPFYFTPFFLISISRSHRRRLFHNLSPHPMTTIFHLGRLAMPKHGSGSI